MPASWSAFRPSAAPAIAVPFGVRSVGQYHVDARTVDDLPPRHFVQLYWCASGRIRFITPKGKAVISAGEIFVYPSKTPHRVAALEPSTMYWWLTVDGLMADQAVEAFGLRPPWPRRAGPPPERLFRRIAALIPDPTPANERAASALGWELLSAAASGGPAATSDDSVERLHRILVDRASDPSLSVTSIANELKADRSVLTRQFTEAFGMAPKPFLQSLRLGRAMALLHTTATPVATVALECGFSDPGYFARAFRKRTGQSPEQFRQG